MLPRLIAIALLSQSVFAAHDFLPPADAWNGRSRALIVDNDHEWVTPSEKTGLTRTPRYDETVDWLERLVAAAPELEMVAIGESAEGRTVWMVVASADRAFTPETLRATGKPTLLVQAGIHAGEIDGKDAGLMLLRDMTVRGTKSELLESANLLFVPILNVDGHERFSAYGRMNQRGPMEMGWRTNARNLNLNRDYTKLETEETQAMVQVINDWQPDLYIDVHVTDGADYQYDITWGADSNFGWSPEINRWLTGTFAEQTSSALEAMDHVPGPFMWPRNYRDFSEGNLVWAGSPRFSNPYGAARHLPTILVENHSLKPYDQRVLGTYVFLEAAMRVLVNEQVSLREATNKDRQRRPDPLVLDWQLGDPPTTRTETIKAIRNVTYTSEISDTERVRWTGEKTDEEVVYYIMDEPVASVARPEFYYVPVAWSHIADKLRLHGITVEQLDTAVTVPVTMYRLPDAAFDTGEDRAFDQKSVIYEGRMRVKPGMPVAEPHEITLLPGSFRVSTDQPLGDLAMLLLEPQSPDSLFQWGFFLEIFSRTGYFEAYVAEPMAQSMLAENADMKAAFEQKLKDDPVFASDAKARIEWFYEQTPYHDQRHLLYPIARSRN